MRQPLPLFRGGGLHYAVITRAGRKGERGMKEKTSIGWIFIPLAVLLISFVGITTFSMIYMAKDNNYNNMIFQYFNVSKEMYGKLIYLKISKDALAAGMNLCGLAFLMGNFLLFWFGSPRKGRRKRTGILIVLSLFLLLQAVVYSTGLQKAIYFGKLGFLPSPRGFRSFYRVFHYITMCGNFLFLVCGCAWMFLVDLRREPIRELWRIKCFILMTEACLIGLYFYMYFSLPDAFLWISRSTGYIAWHSLDMAPYVRGMRLITYLIGLLLLLLFYTFARYQKMRRSVLEEEVVFSSIIASSEISTRSFSHYVKNELLGIIAEAEALSRKTAGEYREPENIRTACEEIYERLNELQKHTNRIVLNQSRQNLAEVITKAVEENRTLLQKEGCEILWEGEKEEIVVFLDPYYMREVFRNLFRNAMEAMSGMDGERRIYVQTRLYDGEVEISVRDTGPGLSPSMQTRLFDPFVSTKSTKQNWGIGLTFCKRIVNSHRGKIMADSGEGKGTRIRILLPVIEEV